MQKYLWMILVIAFIFFTVAAFLFVRHADLSQYEGLVQPRVTRMDSQWMIVTKAHGNPNVAAKHAFQILFKTYYRYADKKERGASKAPRARWPLTNLQDTDMNTWEGEYGIPVSDGFPTPSNAEVKLEKWEYGMVAEILHKRSYETEPATVQKLTRYIEDHQYQIIGDHEEEYLKGPGMFFKGNPDHYLTLIRYRVITGGVEGALSQSVTPGK